MHAAEICTYVYVHCIGVDIACRVSYKSTKRNFVDQICVWTKWAFMNTRRSNFSWRSDAFVDWLYTLSWYTCDMGEFWSV
jgi:hypothetical protein